MATAQLKTFFKTFTANQHGNVDLVSTIDLKEFNTLNFEIVKSPNEPANLKASVYMGKISGTTLSQQIDLFDLQTVGIIRTYSVVGPELAIWINGASPNASVDLQAWVFLH